MSRRMAFLHLPTIRWLTSFYNPPYEDFIKIIDGLHNKWPNTPLLFHDLSKARLNKLRDKYGSFIVRDDIVIQKK